MAVLRQPTAGGHDLHPIAFRQGGEHWKADARFRQEADQRAPPRGHDRRLGGFVLPQVHVAVFDRYYLCQARSGGINGPL